VAKVATARTRSSSAPTRRAKAPPKPKPASTAPDSSAPRSSRTTLRSRRHPEAENVPGELATPRKDATATRHPASSLMRSARAGSCELAIFPTSGFLRLKNTSSPTTGPSSSTSPSPPPSTDIS
jgi:hypothetical protein